MNTRNIALMLVLVLAACDAQKDVASPIELPSEAVIVDNSAQEKAAAERLAEEERLRIAAQERQEQFALAVQNYRLSAQRLDSAIAANDAALKRAELESVSLIEEWQADQQAIENFVAKLDPFSEQDPTDALDAELTQAHALIQNQLDRYQGLTRTLEGLIAARQQSAQKSREWRNLSDGFLAMPAAIMDQLKLLQEQAGQALSEQSFIASTQAHQDMSELYQQWIGNWQALDNLRSVAITAQNEWLAIANDAGAIDAASNADAAWQAALQLGFAGDVVKAKDQYQQANLDWQKALTDGLMRIATPMLIELPAAQVRIGDLSGKGQRDELPVHTVDVAAFALAKTETTYTQFDAYTRLAGLQLHGDEAWGRGSQPVVNISTAQIESYAQWLSQQTGQTWRLPTEFEWEYAARSGGEKDFGEWDDLSGKAHCEGCSAWGNKNAKPTASFAANSYGFYDLTGNVWEWTSSCYSKNYNEKAASQCTEKVLRGGSWSDLPSSLRVSNRSAAAISEQNNRIGFRLVRE